ncbi:hypothetical protein X777_03289, partial [Ooceraea biroi]
GVNAIYTMTTIASLLVQSAYVQPRKGARTPASPFADRRSSGRASQPRTHAGMGVKRARKRREEEHVARPLCGDLSCAILHMSRISFLSLFLSLPSLLPESSAISEFDATSAIRYRPERGLQGNVVSRTVREEKRERRDATRWLDEEKEADDDDGYKGGCPSSFSSAAALRISPGTARQLSTFCQNLPLLKTRSRPNAERFSVSRVYNVCRFRVDG